MKIALLNSYYYPEERGGAERSVRILAEGLVGLGHEVTVLALGDAAAAPQSHNGVNIRRLSIRNAYLPSEVGGDVGAVSRLVWHARDSYNLGARADVRATLKASGAQVLHTNNLSGFSVAAWSAAHALGLPVVHTTRDFYLQCPRTTMMKGEHSCARPCGSCAPFAWPRRMVSQRIQHVVGISRFMLERHQQNDYFDGVPASVIYNSYDGPAAPELRAPGAELVLGFIGRLVPAKGVELLLQAFRRLHADASQGALRLLIGGEGHPDYVAELRRQAEGLPVDFLGHVNPPTFFPRVDVTVAPSVWNEPLGRVVIESMSFGKPVVVTPVGGMPELVAPGAGLVLPEVSADALYASLADLLPALRRDHASWAAKAREASLAYGAAAIAGQYQQVYARYL
ncbi:Glycosyltransferase involved in cell wall bisynthesis [Duganella sp. CF402]|nr:glycosyltransferase involved in cell wall biosynthesis [Duganella sp. BK701]SEN19218.1 Glycosyltransferase involved in cell wall bisynthesis [Duganella sp. CF402]